VRKRILLLSVGMTGLVVLAFAIPLALLIRETVANKALDGARYQAENLAYVISAEHPTRVEVSEYLDRSQGRYDGSTWVEFPDGRTVGDLPQDFDPATVDDDENSEPDHDGDDVGEVSAATVVRTDEGALTTVQTMTVEGPAKVHTFLTDDQLRDGLTGPLLILAAVSIGLLVVSFAGAEALTARLARPLEQTADAAERLAGGDISARAPESGPPEVAKVGTALNGLADRIDEVIAVERESVADMSHRLRTPLTALRLDVDALDDRETASRLGDHVTSLERTLTAVIHAARRPQREGRVPHSDAVGIVRERAAFWMALAEDQGRSVTVTLPDRPASVRASVEDLSAAVDALIENVMAHTPDGTGLGVRVVVTSDHDPVRVRVTDEGPGIPSGAGLRGRSDRGSTGLGLDIARRCAETSGGSMVISRGEGGGAVVELRLGRP
jgi:signal transduction histidine kinase